MPCNPFRLPNIMSEMLIIQSDHPSGEQTQVKLFNSQSTNLLARRDS